MAITSVTFRNSSGSKTRHFSSMLKAKQEMVSFMKESMKTHIIPWEQEKNVLSLIENHKYLDAVTMFNIISPQLYVSYGPLNVE
jgi:hypothetical protein